MLEIVAAVSLLVYLILLPKNYCRFKVNSKDAVVYVNDKKTNKIRLSIPEEEQTFYAFDFNVDLQLSGNANYLVRFVLTGGDNLVYATTTANKTGNTYLLECNGGGKHRLLTGICVQSDKPIKSFDVEVKIEVAKV